MSLLSQVRHSSRIKHLDQLDVYSRPDTVSCLKIVSDAKRYGVRYAARGFDQRLVVLDLVVGVETSGDHTCLEKLQELSIRMAREY